MNQECMGMEQNQDADVAWTAGEIMSDDDGELRGWSQLPHVIKFWVASCVNCLCFPKPQHQRLHF